MSLILEALRKSEAERRRGLAPDVAMELPPTPASRPRAVASWLLPALMVALLLVLAGWWTRREPAQMASPSTDVATGAHAPTSIKPASIKPAPVDMPRIQPKPSNPLLVTEATRSMPPAAMASVTAADPRVPVATATPIQATPIEPAPAPSPAPSLPPPGDIGTDTSMLPPIKLSMLMWDPVPAKRFVILNGQRMVEGDRSGEIRLAVIEHNGVVLESNGARVRVPLP